MNNRAELTADDPKFVRKLDNQIERLRRMLILMGPETGAIALGAARSAAPRAAAAFDMTPEITD